LLRGAGKVAVTLTDLAIHEHVEKCGAFKETLKRYYQGISLVGTIEEHDIESEGYDKCRSLFNAHPGLAGIYVTAEASIPVLEAARDAGILEPLAIITTDLFPALVAHIRSGSVLLRFTSVHIPRDAWLSASSMNFLCEGPALPNQVTLSPHLVMRGNLEFFLERQLSEVASEMSSNHPIDAPNLEG